MISKVASNHSVRFQYLEMNGDKVYVDINIMADDLQRQYKEYGKRKRSAFRSLVKKAYGIVMQTYGIPGVNVSSSEDVSEDSAPEEHFVCKIKLRFFSLILYCIPSHI